MRTLCIAVSAIILSHASIASPQRFPVTVSITTPASTVKSGAPIEITVTISNVTSSMVQIAASPESTEATNYVTVYDAKGRRLPRIGAHNVSVVTGLDLAPYKSTTGVFILNEFADVSHPGTYKIHVDHEFWKFDTKRHPSVNLIPSNTLILTVTK